MGFGSILSVAGPILGALGSKGGAQAAQPTSGFQTLPTEIKDYLMDTIFPKVQEYGAGSYQGLPKRRVNADDLDPVFGSTARRYLQDIQDRKWLEQNYPNGQSAQGGASDADAQARAAQDAEARMMARQYLSSGAGQQGGHGEKIKQMLGAGMYDNAALSDIGKFLMKGEELGYGSTVGAQGMGQRNTAVANADPALYEKFGQAMNSYLAKAMQAKGMM